MSKVSVLIVAAGEGRRFGAAKQFVLLKGETLLDRCLGTFEMDAFVDEIILILPDPGKRDSLRGDTRRSLPWSRAEPGGRIPSGTASASSGRATRTSSSSTTGPGPSWTEN